MITTKEIRQKFTDFFCQRGHQKISSSSLIPQNDPTLLFANAGMNQFKDYFTGKALPPHPRAVTIQKCVRAGGKHNDLENVGNTARHHTFFEMLGNFSFGDYFKQDAIKYAWEFLTQELKMPPEKLLVTVYQSDDEAYQIWHQEIGVPATRIFRRGDKDNFWEMGEFGPCGPCSEIYFDHGEAFQTPNFISSLDNPFDDGGRYVEIWNLVFMQYEKTPAGIVKLPRPSVDTGAGLERLAAALQGKYWNYDADGFLPLIAKVEAITGQHYQDPRATATLRVVADHIRAAVMLITDGVLPANEGRGYVLRRIIRRAVRKLREIEAPAMALHQLVPTVLALLGEEYPQNQANGALAEKMLRLEEKKFLETLDLGLKYLNQAIAEHLGAAGAAGAKTSASLPGEVLFKLYDTYGFPPDLSVTILEERGLAADFPNFEQLMAKRKLESKKSWKAGAAVDAQLFYRLKEKWGATVFIGYHQATVEARLLALEKIGEDYLLIFDQTPFYGESGGQQGDIGAVYWRGNPDTPLATIIDVQKPVEDLWVHFSKDGENLEVGQYYQLAINTQHRQLIARHHSATHLLQAALIQVLGDHIKQAGSSVGADKLRFDFTHPEAITEMQLQQVEALVNQQIRQGQEVTCIITDKDTAIKKGALALFGEKYGEEVRLISMGGFSIELCGGTHVANISEIGLFSILLETSLSAGVRRIEARVSFPAIDRLQGRSEVLRQIEKMVNVKDQMVLARVEALQRELKEAQREVGQLNDQIQRLESGKLFANPQQVGKFVVMVTTVPENSDLKKLSDLFCDKHANGLALLSGRATGAGADKASVLLRSCKSATHVDCAGILREALAVVGGKGGGRKDLAQGSVDFAKLELAVEAIKERLWPFLSA